MRKPVARKPLHLTGGKALAALLTLTVTAVVLQSGLAVAAPPPVTPTPAPVSTPSPTPTPSATPATTAAPTPGATPTPTAPSSPSLTPTPSATFTPRPIPAITILGAPPPVALPLTTTGVGTAEQATDDVTPANGSVSLVGDGGALVVSVATDAGTYLVGSNGGLAFDPNTGFSGTAPTVSYTIINQTMQTSTSTYTATVTKPDPPVAEPLTSTRGAGAGFQYADTSGIPGTDRVWLLPGPDVGSINYPGIGTYAATSGDGISLDFNADACFAGTAPVQGYRIVDAYQQFSDSTYTASVDNPNPPAGGPLASTGLGRTPQTATAVQPSCVGSTMLLDGINPVTSLTRTDGVYTVDSTTGVITYVPAVGYTGTALTPVAYRVTDSIGQSADGTYATTVSPPPPPTSMPLTSTGVGTAIQGASAVVPIGDEAELLDGGNQVDALTVAGQGTYAVDPTNGSIAFLPATAFLGTATPISYIVSDAYGQSTTNTYTATVTPPAPPVAVPLTSTGVGAAVQSHTVSIPSGGGLTLFTPQKLVPEIEVTGEGIYRIDATAGTISFAPFPYFSGTPSPVTYVLVDVYGQTGTSTYSPTVTKPPAPTALPVSSTGMSGQTQQQTVPIPAGSSITLLDGTTPVTMLDIPGQGTYTLNATTGVITFTPLAAYSGTPTPVVYQLTDLYGQAVQSTYSPVVGAVIVPIASTPVATILTAGESGGGVPTSVPAGSGPLAAAPSGSGNAGQLLLAAVGLFVLMLSGFTLRRRRR